MKEAERVCIHIFGLILESQRRFTARSLGLPIFLSVVESMLRLRKLAEALKYGLDNIQVRTHFVTY